MVQGTIGQQILFNQTVTSSGSSLYENVGRQQCILFWNITGSVTGTSPTIQFILQEVDPSDQTTHVGQTVTSSVVNAAGTGQINLSVPTSPYILISWTVGGTTPSFGGTNISVVARENSQTITDSTHGPVAVKNPSIASVTADPSLVTAHSPNSPTPTGTQVVQANATVTTSGSSVITASYGVKEISLFINVKNAPTGTTPTITYTMQEVDPGDQTTALGTSVTGVAITAAGTQILSLLVTQSGIVKVSWTVTGTTPSFTGVYATVTSKLPGVMLGVDASGVQHPLLTDSSGNMKTNIAPVTGGAIAFGDITLNTNNTLAPVRRTTYTEQTTNFTGSIVSSSANDTTAGTGARTVIITYLDQTGAGPYTETVTLHGTTAVNLVNTNHAFIESIIVVTVGSNASNVGTITLFTGAAGAGTNVGSIGAGDNRTFWSHHYTPTGKTTYITGSLIANTSSTVGAGAIFYIKAISLSIANDVEKQVTDTLTLYGQSSMTPRLYTTAIPLAVGPARLIMYVTTLSSTTQTYRASFDYYDQ